MNKILFDYVRVDPTTWAYLASLLTIALYFKFSRIWSVRNLDLLGLILLAPALLLVQHGMDHVGEPEARTIEHIGYICLFIVDGLFFLRLTLDAFMVRRPLLEPNLSVGGLAFLGVSLYLFLIANVMTGIPELADVTGSQRAAHLGALEASHSEQNSLATHGPGFPLIYLLPQISTQSLLGDKGQDETPIPEGAAGSPRSVPLVHVVTAQVMAILSQLAIVVGMVLIGMRHFDNVKTGIAAATLYLLLPYTAMWTGSVTHALPGALIVWAVVFYRRPVMAGVMIGLAIGTIYYPVFLLPLWISFYWHRGLIRFLIGMIAMIALSVLVLALQSIDVPMFYAGLQQMFGLRAPIAEDMSGAWRYWRPVYRYPILAAFVGWCLSLALWPAQKNLATLISYSAAIMLGTQFWHAHSGGLALAWYLPLLLLTTFRPNLEDRVAISVVK